MKNSKSRSHKCGSGFTLIELIIVIAIVGILAAIAIPVLFEEKSSSSSVNESQKIEKTVGTDVEEHNQGTVY